jgi:hypothetical protein
MPRPMGMVGGNGMDGDIIIKSNDAHNLLRPETVRRRHWNGDRKQTWSSAVGGMILFDADFRLETRSSRGRFATPAQSVTRVYGPCRERSTRL